MDTTEDAYTNIIVNGVSQVDLRKSAQVLGAAEYVFLEVLVSYIMRYFIKSEKKSVLQLLSIHTASLPFIGGLGAIGSAGHPFGLEAGYTDQLMEGLKGVPAVLWAEYLVETGAGGFHVPKPSIRDLLITSASKVITKPLMSILYPMIGNTLRDNLDVLEEIFKRQRHNSNLLSQEKQAKEGGRR